MPHRLRVLLLVLALVAVGATLLHAVRARRGVRAERVALVWDVPSSIDEAPPTAGGAFSWASLRKDEPSLWEITGAVRAAAKDDAVRALVLHVGETEWGWGRVAEMREAIAAFRAAGKPVWVSLQGGSDESYLLVSRADHIAVPPTTTLAVDGLSATAMFFKGAYDKLGIVPNYAHVGRFKSAVEQQTRSAMSEPARAALESLLGDEFSLFADSLAAARGVAPARMRALVDEGPFTAGDAVAAGLADTLADEADLDSLALGRGPKALGEERLERYAEGRDAADGGDHIALIPAVGTIMPGRSREDGWQGSQLGSESIIAALREARDRRAVRAVVLRIDSPGGSGEASDDIWREVERVRRVKPVVVSMSNLAASGGYYIACGADAIVSEPGTITGSIGVFGGKLNVIGLYRKLGLNVETISRGRHAEMMSPFHDFTPDEAAKFQAQLDAFYRVFVTRVAAGRGMTAAAVDSVGQGRVWSGLSARRFGLVDSLGGVQAAVAIARDHAHLAKGADVPVVLYPHPHRPYLRRLLGGLLRGDDPNTDARLAALPPVVAAWVQAARFPAGMALAMLPVSIEIR